jgi:integrase
MSMTPHWKIDTSKILTRAEIAAVLTDLKRRGVRSVNSRMNLIIFRLATCCGLRAREIAGLKLHDVRVGVEKPYLYLPKQIAKGKKTRQVPLWWDDGTRDDITAWRAERQRQGAKQGDYFVCAQSKAAFGRPLSTINIRHRFQVACRVLGADRLFIGQDKTQTGRTYNKHLTVHHGRHSFCSHALAAGVSLAQVRDAAGHSDISITSVYTHVVGDADEPKNIFEFDKRDQQQ